MRTVLKRLAQATGILARLRGAWRQDVHDATEPLRNEVRRLRRDVERLQTVVQATGERAARADRTAAQLKAVALLNEQQRERLSALPVVLDEARIADRARAAFAAVSLETEPFEHCIVERLLPSDVYELLLESLPPAAFFSEHDPVKQDLPLPTTFAPALTEHVWNFVDEVIAPRILRPIVMGTFEAMLQRHYAFVFGETHCEQAARLPLSTSGGRLMLRRPGYHLEPHRDPKRAFVTCLLYLARPGDNEAFGTQIFRVHDDTEADYKQTFFPQQEGHRCELVKVVPFRPNSLLAFVNSRGAHGASLPADAPADVERYAYQFYVAPKPDALAAFIKKLPPARRRMWQNKSKAR